MPLQSEPATQKPLYALTSFSSQRKVLSVQVNLTPLDNSPDHFWSTLVTTLSVWDLDFCNQQRQRGFPGSLVETNTFFQDFAAALEAHPLLLIINGLHRLNLNEVQLFLQTLLQVPSGESSVILLYNDDSGISQPQAPHRPDRFHFCSPEEEEAYYARHTLQLSPVQLAHLRTFTEGWGPAIEVMAGAMIFNDREVILADLDAYLEQWLEQEYFLPYPERVKIDLLLVSLLDEFTLEMFHYTTYYPMANLRKLMEHSPVVHIHKERGTYSFSRYYHQFLRARQGMITEERRRAFYIHIGDWCRENGDKVKAISYYQQAGSNEKLLEILAQWQFQYTPELASCYIQTIEGMPEEFISEHPILQLMYCFMLSAQYRYEEVEELTTEFCWQYDQGDETPPEMRPIVGEAYLLCANAKSSLPGRESIHYYKKAGEFLRHGSALSGQIILASADSYTLRLRSPQAGSLDEYLEDVREAAPHLAAVWGGSLGGQEHLAEAELSFLRREFKGVELPAQRAVRRGLETRQYDIVCSTLFLLMRYHIAKGCYEQLMDCLEQLRRFAAEAEYRGFFSMPELAESWLNLKLGRTRDVTDWIRDEALNRQTVPPRHVGRDRVVRALYLLANREFLQLLPFLDSSLDILQKRGLHLMRVELLIVKAIALAQTGDPEDAVHVFEEAYHWTHLNGIVTIFSEFGSPLRQVLACCRNQAGCAIPPEWLDEMEKKAATYTRYQNRIRKQYRGSGSKPSSPLDSLTPKETNLLLGMYRGLTHAEIAEQAEISLHTVKKRFRRIYAKIGAESKGDAIRIMAHHIEELGVDNVGDSLSALPGSLHPVSEE